jgi:hypothetical protein
MTSIDEFSGNIQVSLKIFFTAFFYNRDHFCNRGSSPLRLFCAPPDCGKIRRILALGSAAKRPLKRCKNDCVNNKMAFCVAPQRPPRVDLLEIAASARKVVIESRFPKSMALARL